MEKSEVDQILAAMLMAGVLQRETMKAMVRKGLFNPDEAREIYESGLLALEEQRGSSRHGTAAFDLARQMMEAHLRNAPRQDPQQ